MKNTKTYCISIIICLHNSSQYIQKLINNLKDIDSKKVQIVFIDDGSTDNTYALLKKYEKNINFKILKQDNQGLASSRNNAVRNCDSEWIAILDHDDKYTKEKIHFCNLFDKSNVSKNNTLIFSNTKILSKSNLIIDKYKINHFKNINLNKTYAYYNLLKMGCFIVSSSAIFSKKIFKDVGGFNKNLFVTCDYDFFIRSSKKFDILFINEVHCIWKEHKNQTSNVKILNHYMELINIYFREIRNINLYKTNIFPIYFNFLKYNVKFIYLLIINYGIRFKI